MTDAYPGPQTLVLWRRIECWIYDWHMYDAYMGDMGIGMQSVKVKKPSRHKKPMTHGLWQFLAAHWTMASANMLPSAGHKVSIWWSPSLRMQSICPRSAMEVGIIWYPKTSMMKDHLKVSAVVMGGNGFQSGLQFRFVKYGYLTGLDA